MAIQQAMCTSFKVALFNGEMDFSADTTQVFKIALYTDVAVLDASTTAYTTTGEVVGTGYTAGGTVLTISQNPTSSGTTAFIDFENASWPASTITSRGALVYSTAAGNPSAGVLDFGINKTTSGGNFIVQFPSPTAAEAIFRLA